MNNKVLTVFVIVLSIASAFLLFQNFQLHGKLNSLKNSNMDKDSNIRKTNPVEEVEFEVAPLMSRMQIYANKLWYAGDSENWDLAAFYFEEIEEVMEEIEKTEAEENGVSLSQAVKDWGLEPIGNMGKAVVSKDKKGFISEYENMIINCNGCHTITKHPYIKIIKPTTPIFSNQKYSIQ